VPTRLVASQGVSSRKLRCLPTLPCGPSAEVRLGRLPLPLLRVLLLPALWWLLLLQWLLQWLLAMLRRLPPGALRLLLWLTAL
jgi:hypothetical protein